MTLSARTFTDVPVGQRITYDKVAAVGDNEPTYGDPVPKLATEASKVGLAWRAQDEVPPKPLYKGRQRIVGVVLEMEEYPNAAAALGRLSKSVMFIAGGYESFGTDNAPLGQGKDLLVLVSPIQKVSVKSDEPRGNATFAGAEPVDAENHPRH